MGTQQEYHVGIYCRLSVDDGTNNESMSIGNQRQMLSEYVCKQGWNIEEIYIDDGWSGTTFERPDFKRLICDIESGRINLVIVKDLSRLGRNYILCGQYTEIYFPERNVRFIALNDGIDSIQTNNDIAPFKNILNDMYAKDISVKVRSSLHAKARRGEFLGANAPYGYIRDPNDRHRLIINPEVAPNIKRLFELVASGDSLYKTAKIFTDEGILTPADYIRFRKHNPADGEFVPQYKWDKSVLNQIVHNQRYVGDMVQCRKRIQSYRNHKQVWNPKEDWIVVEGTHEGIVSKELFDAVLKAIEGRTRIIKKKDEPHMFSGLFFCKDCGRRMAHHIHAKSDYFSCGKYRADGKAACSSHFITVSALSEIVLADIQKHVTLLQSDEEKAVKRIMDSKFADEEKRLSKAKRDLREQKKRQSELDSRIKKVYEDNVSGKLPDELFQTFLRDYEVEKVTLKESIRSLEDEVHTLEAVKTDASQFIALLRQYTDITVLDRPTLIALIDRITISEPPDSFGRNRDQTIEIHYKFAGVL
jgi:site-specific DNA recombinase